MNIRPLYTRQESSEEGVITQTQWGYCREQNTVRLGYCVNVLAALMGLVLMLKGSVAGIWVCALVGASFGVAYFSEQMQVPEIHFTWGPKLLLNIRLQLVAAAFTVAAYLLPLIAFWG